jgi:hypothetical protein
MLNCRLLLPLLICCHCLVATPATGWMSDQVCQLPTILAHPWFERLVATSTTRLVSKAAFVDWWTSRQLLAASATKRLWEVLRPDGKHFLTYADFRPLLQVGGHISCGRQGDKRMQRYGLAAVPCVLPGLIWTCSGSSAATLATWSGILRVV